MARRKGALTAFQIKRHAYWRQMIARWRESDLSGMEFCRQNKLQFRQLSKWKIRLAAQSGSTPAVSGDFIEVGPAICHSVYEIITPGNYRIRIEGDCQPEILSNILSAVSRIC
jgi:hypothetical protein